MATLQVTLTYPDAKQVDLRDTLCNALGYTDTMPDANGNPVPNPETKGQFLIRMCQINLSNWVRNTYKTQKEREALIAASAQNDIQIS